MILTLDLETLLKVTAHPLPKRTMWVKYELEWTIGRKYMIQTRILPKDILWIKYLEARIGQEERTNPPGKR